MASNWHRRLVVLVVAVHAVLVLSIVTQPLDGGTPPTSRRFVTARLSYDSANWPGPGADFFALYHAGLQVRAGKSPHDLNESPRVTPYFFRYIYSPLLGETLGRGVSLLPARAAYLAWVVAIEAVLATWLLVLWRSTLDARSKTAAAAILLVNQPYLLELHMGQFTFVAIACALFAATRVRAGRTAATGAALLAAATIIKTFPAATLPAFVRDKRGRLIALGGIVALGAIGWVSARAASGPMSLGSHDLVGVPHPGAYSIPQAVFVLVLALTNVWLPTAWPLAPAAIVVLVVGAAAVVVWRARPDPVAGSAFMALAFLASYFHAWEHHYSAAILAGTALLLPGRGAIDEERRPLALLLLAWLALPTLYAISPMTWSVGTWIALSLWKSLPLAALLMLAMRPARLRA